MERAGKKAEGYIALLSEKTMRRAWKDASERDRRRLALGAVLFGGRLDEALAVEDPKLVYEQDVQRFLMRLMNAVIRDFADAENLSVEEAGAFLGDVDNRDRIFEFNEVIDAFGADETGVSLDELLLSAVRDRRERALWSDHWTSG